MSYRVTWPKEYREQAATEGRSLLAVGYEGKGGRYEFYGPCDDDTAQLVFFLANKLHMGMPLDQAVAETKESLARRDAKRLAKAEAGSEVAKDA